MKIALQLYTVRDTYKTKEEFKEVLAKVKEIGYEGVEFAGYCDMPAAELRDYLETIALVPVSAHHSIHELEEKGGELLAYISELGCKNLVCAYSETSNKEQVEHTIAIIKKVKDLAIKYGIEIGYHNHSHEFYALEDGTIPMDLIKEACKLEVDTYWVFHAKKNPERYLKENSNNIILVHLKDGDLLGHPLALGEGENHIADIVEASKEIGVKWAIVENDDPTLDGIKDVTRSFEFLKELEV